MRRTKTVLGVVAVMAAMLVAFAAQAMANDHNDWDWDWNDRHDNDRWWWDWNDNDNDRWWENRLDRFDFDNGFFFGGGEIDQDFEQEAESGDVDQSFDVSGTGDNSNQTAGTQGVANTGNAQNQIGVFQIGSEADDFEFDEVGSSIEVSPTTTTSSDQDVDQAASASD
jgi:opacity protein-like surface antigen